LGPIARLEHDCDDTEEEEGFPPEATNAVTYLHLLSVSLSRCPPLLPLLPLSAFACVRGSFHAVPPRDVGPLRRRRGTAVSAPGSVHPN